ncbi:hypothetical protein [Streptomyces sp. NPDC087300]|uniref:hypothetical protein n=1 Tax=Streptomyces sp. NPDC087300 TaxID=3365780 RepID=UPI0037F597E8
MTTPNQLRKAALALPETVEGARGGEISFAVRGKRFAALAKDGVVQLRLADAEAASAVAAHPTAPRRRPQGGADPLGGTGAAGPLPARLRRPSSGQLAFLAPQSSRTRA